MSSVYRENLLFSINVFTFLRIEVYMCHFRNSHLKADGAAPSQSPIDFLSLPRRSLEKARR